MLNLPNGTHVVTTVDKKTSKGFLKRGSVGEIKQQISENVFLVKLPDNREVELNREDLMSQRDSFRVEHITVDLSPEEIRPMIAFEFISGSTAYGLNTADSDEDIVGAYVLPTQWLLGMKKFQETVQVHEPADAAYHEIQKLMQLACKGNPNVMEYGEIYKIKSLVKVAPTNEFVIEMFDRWNELFLSKYVFKSYQGYAMSQFKKIEQDLRNHENIRWKHASHLLRLLWAGIQCMKNGHVVVRPKDVDENIHRDLMEIKNGLWTAEQVDNRRLTLEKEFQSEFDKTKLPDQANFEEAHNLLVKIRMNNLQN